MDKWKNNNGESKRECGVITPRAPQNTKEWRNKKLKDRKEERQNERIEKNYKKMMRERFEEKRDKKNRPLHEQIMRRVRELQEKYAQRKLLRSNPWTHS